MFGTLLALLVLCAGAMWGQPVRGAHAPAFDVAAATDAYLAKVPPEKKVQSDAYFEGGYWLILWDFLYAATISVLLLSTRLSERMRSFAERMTPYQPLRTFAYWVQYLLVTFVVGFPLAVWDLADSYTRHPRRFRARTGRRICERSTPPLSPQDMDLQLGPACNLLPSRFV